MTSKPSSFESYLSKVLTISWITERPFADRCRISSDFSLGESTWYMKMESNVNLCNDSKQYYTITLIERESRNPETPFSVLVVFGKNREDANIFHNLSSLSTVESNRQIIWSRDMKKVSSYLPNFHDYTGLVIYCVFKDFVPSMCRIKNETNDVSIQTDVVWPLTTLRESNILPPSGIPPEELKHEQDSDALENLSRDLSNLLDEQRFADVKLICGERSFFAHRYILAARSKVFAHKLQTEMVQNEPTNVDFSYVDGEILELLLKYMYSGRIPLLTNETAPKLCAAGRTYAVRGLQKACSEWMVGHLTEENCVGILKLADESGDDSFKNAVASFIISHPQVMNTEDWLRFSEISLKLANEVYQKFVRGALDKNKLSD